MRNIVIIFSLLLFASCAHKTAGEATRPATDTAPETESTDAVNSGMPDTYQALSIKWHQGGGMLNLSKDIIISTKGSSWKKQKNGHTQQVPFGLTRSEIRELYDFLVDQEFDKIKSKDKGQVMDRGGTTIELTVDEKEYEIDNSYSMFVLEKWHDNYRAITDKIQAIAKSKVDEKRRPLTVKLDKSIIESGYNIRFYVDETILLNTKKDPSTAGTSEFEVRVLNQETEFELYLDHKPEEGKPHKNFTSLYEWPNILPVTRAVVLKLQEDKIVLEQVDR